MTILERPPVTAAAPETVAAPGRSRRRRERPAPTPRAAAVSTGLILTAGLAAWLMLCAGPLSGLYESHQQARLYQLFREQLASSVTPPPPFAPGTVLHRGDPVAVLSIPDAGIHNQVVVEGSAGSQLRNGPGHLPGTVLPGEAGRSTILGRAFAFGGPFGDFASLHAGSLITVTTGQGTFHYKTVDFRGPHQPIPGSLAQATSWLTLGTAATNGWRNLWVPRQAVYVDAVLTGGKAVQDVTGVAPTPADSPMATDSSGLFLLVLWLQVLLAAAVLATWAAVRWGRRPTYVVATPVLVALLWIVTLQAAPLLPNLL